MPFEQVAIPPDIQVKLDGVKTGNRVSYTSPECSATVGGGLESGQNPADHRADNHTNNRGDDCFFHYFSAFNIMFDFVHLELSASDVLLPKIVAFAKDRSEWFRFLSFGSPNPNKMSF